MEKEKRSKITRITISGYKSISPELPQSVALGDINIVIGANGAGKSNFVSFFKMLNFMMTGELQTYVGRNGFAEDLLYFGSKKTQLIKASLEFKNEKKYTNVYTFSLVKTIQDSLIFSEEIIETNGKQFPLAGGQKESFLISPDANYKNEQVVKLILSRCRAFQFHDTSDNSYIRAYSDLSNDHWLTNNAGNLATILYRLKTATDFFPYYRRIVQFVQRVLPQLNDFYLEPQKNNPEKISLRWLQKGYPEYIMGPEQLSDGSIRFIALATLFLQPPELLPNVIIIDEPELGLHPQAVDILVTMMKMASQHTQIIAATQSARLLNNFGVNDIIVAEMNRQKNATEFKRLSEKELDSWLEDYSLSELWEKNILGGQP
ncbi:MAG: AAA family ATPase [Treponema sp.]|nr:AAA family ATPase [Candidatus Treponema caballi]